MEMNIKTVSMRISELSLKKQEEGLTDTEQHELLVLSSWIKERCRGYEVK